MPRQMYKSGSITQLNKLAKFPVLISNCYLKNVAFNPGLWKSISLNLNIIIKDLCKK